MKNQKAITLIALVITIIVLLILAGISITLISGENGIIGKTLFAKEKYTNSAENEIYLLDNFGEEIAASRGESDSKIINDFQAIINESTTPEITVTSNATTNDGSEIVGYAYLVNGIVKEYTKEDTYKFENTRLNNRYDIQVIAMDKLGNTKRSSLLRNQEIKKVYALKGIDEKNDITNGYGSKVNTVNGYTSSKVAINNSTGLLAPCTNNRVAIFTNNKIDLTNVNKITIKCAVFVDGGGASNTTYFGVSDNKNLNTDFIKYTPVTSSSTSANEQTVEIDTSNIQGEHYIKIYTSHSPSPAYYTAETDIYSIMIEG